MAPSRGLFLQFNCGRLFQSSNILGIRRSFASFSGAIIDPSNRIQSYVSRSNDPYLNLSIEHHLLQTSLPNSTILFLYTNRPCIVIGRNQNPWLEVNLRILRAIEPNTAKETEPPAIGDVDLVRRRSGGGTVFHDKGNVNWSIICPPANFTRDKHAEMVVRALRKLGIDRARVNERHDIVLDQGHRRRDTDPQDTHKTPYTVDAGAGPRPLKVSGSAYKLTRRRALHHGTCLLASPNLHIIPQYLHSPAKPYLKARGVESVSSPVSNIGLANQVFEKSVQDEFAIMYGDAVNIPTVVTVDEEHLGIPEIRKGYDELKTLEWTYSQTPQFTLSSHPVDEDSREMAPRTVPFSTRIDLKVQHGVITESLVQGPAIAAEKLKQIQSRLQNQKLHDIKNWNHLLTTDHSSSAQEIDAIATWLGAMMPIAEKGEV
ncbi:hypothetical protein AOQ84DRAFT_379342 [Glonium stellatum]|uniref:Putative lipoate-protein ligase A n=1 Tax=Glonium stellatum TaxID=574774 RepID=A0A8E2EVG1_9PEZI|nr:hypothetical protein AOQ84DRAFT_379342 [Glonium stellatum]